MPQYVIMPTHIHAIIRLLDGPAPGNSRPGLPEVICAYKSLATRAYNRAAGRPGQKLFQTSFYEEVLRSEQAYQACWLYIDGNPGKWLTNPEDI